MHFNDPTIYSYLVGGAIAIIVSVIIILKERKVVLNILFGSTLLFWGISLLTNALTFLFKDATGVGVQIVRDIATSSGSIGAFLLFATSLAMYRGVHYLKKWYFLIPWIIIMGVNTIIGSVFDYVVDDIDTGYGVKTTQEPWVLIFLYLMPLIMISISEIYLGLTRKVVKEKIIKTRIRLFMWGFLFIIIGIVDYIIFSLIENLTNYLLPNIEYASWIIASIFWAAAPILMLIGFFIGKVKVIWPQTEKHDTPEKESN
ncbi:MAG: hypothetical protein ACFFDW_16900 [Candidatus Thorarchaeota archaeon]